MAEKGGFTYNDQNQYGFAPGQEQNVPPQQYQNPPPYAPPSQEYNQNLGVNAPGAPYPPPGNQVVIPTQVGPDPIRVTCPNCHAMIETRTVEETGQMAYILAAVLCVVG